MCRYHSAFSQLLIGKRGHPLSFKVMESQKAEFYATKLQHYPVKTKVYLKSLSNLNQLQVQFWAFWYFIRYPAIPYLYLLSVQSCMEAGANSSKTLGNRQGAPSGLTQRWTAIHTHTLANLVKSGDFMWMPLDDGRKHTQAWREHANFTQKGLIVVGCHLQTQHLAVRQTHITTTPQKIYLEPKSATSFDYIGILNTCNQDTLLLYYIYIIQIVVKLKTYVSSSLQPLLFQQYSTSNGPGLLYSLP